MGKVLAFRASQKINGNSVSSVIGGSVIFTLSLTLFLTILVLPRSWFDPTRPLSGLSAGTSDTEMARFGYCHTGGGQNCVVDGDTFYYRGQKFRIADIDTPETHPPKCASEARLGNAATQRLNTLLNAGPFALRSIDRDTDVYGRKLRTVIRGGSSLGGQLVNEGLARYYGNGRQPWC